MDKPLIPEGPSPRPPDRRPAGAVPPAARETTFQRLYDTMREGVAISTILFDAKGRAKDYSIDDVNPAFEAICGLSRRQAVGKKASRVYGTGSAPFLETFAQVAAGEGPTVFETYFRPLHKHLHISAFSPAPGRFAIVCSDITRRRRTEETLNNFFALSGDLLAVCDLDGRLLSVNPTMEGLLGAPAEELCNRPLLDFVLPEDQAATTAKIRTLADGEPVVRFENRLRCPNGSTRQVSWTATPDPLTGTVYTVGRDVTEERRSEEERHRLESQLHQAQKMEAIGTLAGGIAHDFNNILAAILGFAELSEQLVPAHNPARGHLRMVVQSCLRARDLIRQILTFSRRSQADLLPLRLQLIVKEALKLLRSTLPASISIVERITADCPPVRTDPVQIHQVLINLATNAVQAMGDTGVMTISLAAQQVGPEEASRHGVLAGEYVQLAVADTGCGIDPAIRDRIFEPYFTSKEAGQGSGLGLAVVGGITRSHRGFVTVDSTPGQGSVFRVWLPTAAEPESAQVPATEEATQGGSERILFVDDDASLAALGQLSLGRLGYQVTACTRSPEALTLVQDHPEAFDLVICDLAMPEMRGEDLVRHLLALRSDLPIILSTGHGQELNAGHARALGARDLLTKPWTRADLATMVRRILDRGA
ncbi:MAG: ATP-binding protein [Thermodesulfobacteriota bacterium]